MATDELGTKAPWFKQLKMLKNDSVEALIHATKGETILLSVRRSLQATYNAGADDGLFECGCYDLVLAQSKGKEIVENGYG
jgi:hypothetical protein